MKDIFMLIGCAVFVRLLILPCTLKTDKYFSVMNVLYKNLNMRIHTIAARFADNPAKSYVEEISAIDRMADQFQAYRKPLFLILPIVLQAAAFFSIFLFLRFLHSESGWQIQFFWFRDLSAKDPYYLLPPVFLILLIIRHIIFIPHKMKWALALPDLLLFILSLNQPAALNIFVIVLIFLSTVQLMIIKQRYQFPSMADTLPESLSANPDGCFSERISASDNKNAPAVEPFVLNEWLLSFKKKTSIFLYDDVLVSLLIGIYLGIGGLIVYLLYWAYFHWQIKRDWLV
jgi:membrane protein insertase Oxa1/YidC/SpoIIIJ